MPRYKRLKKANRKKGKTDKKRIVKDDNVTQKKEDVKNYELRKLMWKLRDGKLKYGKAAGRASGSSWIAAQNDREVMRNQLRTSQLIQSQQQRDHEAKYANLMDQFQTYRAKNEMEKEVREQRQQMEELKREAEVEGITRVGTDQKRKLKHQIDVVERKRNNDREINEMKANYENAEHQNKAAELDEEHVRKVELYANRKKLNELEREIKDIEHKINDPNERVLNEIRDAEQKLEIKQKTHYPSPEEYNQLIAAKAERERLEKLVDQMNDINNDTDIVKSKESELQLGIKHFIEAYPETSDKLTSDSDIRSKLSYMKHVLKNKGKDYDSMISKMNDFKDLQETVNSLVERCNELFNQLKYNMFVKQNGREPTVEEVNAIKDFDINIHYGDLMKEMRNIEIQKGNLEKGVGMQNDIDSMNEQNRAVEHELQQRRGTSASGQELMDEISKEHIDVTKQSDLMSEIVKKQQDIDKMRKECLINRKKLVSLKKGIDDLPEVIDDEYVAEQQVALDEAEQHNQNVKKAYNANAKAITIYNRAAKQMGVPDDSGFYETTDLQEKSSMMGKYLADQEEALQRKEEELEQFKQSYDNIRMVRGNQQKSLDELHGKYEALYPDNVEYVDDVINNDDYTYEEKLNHIFWNERKQALDMAKTATLYQAAIMVGDHNKQDEQHTAELNDLVGRLYGEAVYDKRYNTQKENIYQKGTDGFKYEVNQIMQTVNPMYDGVNIEQQYRPTYTDAGVVLERINEDSGKLRDEDEVLNMA